MPFGQINPLNFVVAQRLAANQNVDASTATRHALIGTLLGEGLLGPIIARQLAMRDAAPSTPATSVTGATPTPDTAVAEVKRVSDNLETWLKAERQRDAEELRRAEELRAEAEKRQKERTDALRALCDSLGSFESGSAPQTGAEEGAQPASKKQSR